MDWYVGQGSRIVHELLEEKGEDFLMIPLDGHTTHLRLTALRNRSMSHRRPYSTPNRCHDIDLKRRSPS